MTKQAITEESGVHEQWKVEAKEQTLDSLEQFVRRLIDDYEHDYGTIIHALFASMLATFYAMNNSPQGGITGFQAGCLMWMFVREFGGFSKEGHLRILDSENLLYPQYDDRWTTLRASTWTELQDLARKKLAEHKQQTDALSETIPHPAVLACPRVVARWESIVRGEVPCGLTVLAEQEAE